MAIKWQNLSLCIFYRVLKHARQYGFSKAQVYDFFKINPYLAQYGQSRQKTPAKRKNINHRAYFNANMIMTNCQVDLYHISEHFNETKIYVLLVIDSVSRYLFGHILKNKSKEQFLIGLQAIVKQIRKLKPQASQALPDFRHLHLQSDLDAGINNKLVLEYFKREDISIQFMTQPNVKSPIIERASRTFGTILNGLFHMNKTFRFVKSVNDAIMRYNTTLHTAILDTPKNIVQQGYTTLTPWIPVSGQTDRSDFNYIDNKLKLDARMKSALPPLTPIRVHYREAFRKGVVLVKAINKPYWSDEIWYIKYPKRPIFADEPIVYKIMNFHGVEQKFPVVRLDMLPLKHNDVSSSLIVSEFKSVRTDAYGIVWAYIMIRSFPQTQIFKIKFTDFAKMEKRKSVHDKFLKYKDRY